MKNIDDQNKEGANTEENSDLETSVFFSYSRVDQQQALPIIAAIERAGYKVWWDGMLDGGTSFLETTEQALESAKSVVVLWSETSVASHWVRDEAMSGRIRERLIPLSLDGTVPPLGFRQVQVIDFLNWKDSDQEPVVQELHRVLASLHGRAPRPQSDLLVPAATVFSRRNLLLGACGVGGATMAGMMLAGKIPIGQPKIHGNGIAVLPFTNLSDDKDKEYLATGLSSEIRNALARNESLQVVARSSSQAITAISLSAKVMAKRLGVANLLDGSIRFIGESVRVTVELIDGKTGFNLWSKEYTQPIGNILSVQLAITEALIPLLTKTKSGTKFDPTQGGTQNPSAFNEYLKGTALFNSTIDQASNQQALAHINAAINTDPNFGSAYATKAQLLLWLGATSADSKTAQDLFKSAVNAAKRSVDLSPNLAKAHSTLGYVLVTGQLNIKGAQIPYERSRELGNGDAAVLARYATYMTVTSRHTEALSAIKRAVKLDPLNETIYQTSSLVHYAAGLYEDAIKTSKRVLSMSPQYVNAKAQIGMSLINLGRIEEGVATCESEINQMERLPCLAIGHNKLGNQEAATAAMTTLIGTYGDAGAYQQAQVLSAWGELDQAMQTLEKAVVLGDSGLTLAGFDPTLNPLREREDFLNLLAQLGL
ncbi:TIR domain-containing protein [bacterium AH-315-J23]|nr:TIR domain-containing protein [bacterium AH-315-J23]